MGQPRRPPSPDCCFRDNRSQLRSLLDDCFACCAATELTIALGPKQSSRLGAAARMHRHDLDHADQPDGVIAFDGKHSCAGAARRDRYAPRKGTPAPTDADDRFDDSRHPRRTLAPTVCDRRAPEPCRSGEGFVWALASRAKHASATQSTLSFQQHLLPMQGGEPREQRLARACRPIRKSGSPRPHCRRSGSARACIPAILRQTRGSNPTAARWRSGTVDRSALGSSGFRPLRQPA